MTTFVYKAKKSNAETVSGQITAQSQEEAIELINQLGFLPISVQPQTDEGPAVDLAQPRKVKSKTIYLFSRQLANLLKSGVSILRALAIIEEQTQDRYFRRVIANIRWGIKNGKSLSECLSLFPHIFSNLYVAMIHAGEESSNLQKMFVSISQYQRRQEEILSKVRTAMAYPIFMGVMGLATVYFILTFVLPKMSGLFESLGDTIPLPTLMLLGLSRFLHEAGIWIFLFILIVAFSFMQWLHTRKGSFISSQFLLKLPLFGEIILKTELARFCRTLVLLSRSGASIVKALQITIPMLSNDLLKLHLEKCKEDLMAGGLLGESIKESGQIPAMMGHLISVGEESGNLDEVLEEIAETYEAETDEKIKLMTTLLEPMMILAVGLIIGFIVFAMLLPIFEINVLAK